MLETGMFLVDRYEILSKVGLGGMADVYKAKDHILGRTVAIKVLKAEFSEDINFVTKFRTEAQSAAGLEHPNIVNIYDVGSENGMHFIVMEYVEGITLKTYVEKKGQLAFKEATSIAIQVARGIEAAHNKNITHRDIKPQNIIISTEGKVKVTDFGIAKAISSNTVSSEAMGSVHYASPEQARNGFIDGRSDIYSLGIVMYEMVTGRVPFDGETTVAVAIQHLQEEMVEPSAYAPELPISYERIVLKCTQKSPERRYQDIVELLADLRKALVTPDEDFVVIAPVALGDTRIINGEELEEIQNTANETNLDTENGFSSLEGEEEEEEYDDEEDATGFLDPKMEKIVTISGIAIAAIIVIIIAFMVGTTIADALKFGGNTQDTSSQNSQVTEQTESTPETQQEELVKMIDLTGMKVEDAEAALAEIGLELYVLSYQESDKADGTILKQSEELDADVAKGTTINVIVAGENTSVEKFSVPKVVGAEEEDAYNKLVNEGFLVTRKYEESSKVEKGLVISQTPEAGESHVKGTRVTIVISKGQEKEMVPADLVGKKASVVQDKLEDLGFEVTIKEQYNTQQPAGVVFKVDGAGTKKKVGSTIKVYVSLGEEPSPKVTIPTNLVGMAKDDVVSTLTGLGLSVNIVTETNDQPAGVVFKVDGAGTEVDEGTSVTIYVSNGPAPQPSETPTPDDGTGTGDGTGTTVTP